MPELHSGSKPGLSRLRVQHPAAELPSCTIVVINNFILIDKEISVLNTQNTQSTSSTLLSQSQYVVNLRYQKYVRY